MAVRVGEWLGVPVRPDWRVICVGKVSAMTKVSQRFWRLLVVGAALLGLCAGCGRNELASYGGEGVVAGASGSGNTGNVGGFGNTGNVGGFGNTGNVGGFGNTGNFGGAGFGGCGNGFCDGNETVRTCP